MKGDFVNSSFFRLSWSTTPVNACDVVFAVVGAVAWLLVDVILMDAELYLWLVLIW